AMNASICRLLPRSVTRSRQRAVPVIGYRSGAAAGALLPPRSSRGLHETGYVEGQVVILLGLSFLDTLRRTEHVARGSLWERFDLTAKRASEIGGLVLEQHRGRYGHWRHGGSILLREA